MVPNSYRIACVVHQLQLAINKWCCQSDVIERMLHTSRRLAAKLRTSKVKRALRIDGLPLVIIDQQTRWSSKHNMTVRLALLKEFCDDHSGQTNLLKGNIFSKKISINLTFVYQFVGITIHPSFWKILVKFNKVLQPLSLLTKQLQDEQLTIPKFNEVCLKSDQTFERTVIDLKWKLGETLRQLLRERRSKIDDNWRRPWCRWGAAGGAGGRFGRKKLQRSEPADNFGSLVGSLTEPSNTNMGQATQTADKNSIKYQLQQYEQGHYNEVNKHLTNPVESWAAGQNLWRSLAQSRMRCTLNYYVSSHRSHRGENLFIAGLRLKQSENVLEERYSRWYFVLHARCGALRISTKKLTNFRCSHRSRQEEITTFNDSKLKLWWIKMTTREFEDTKNESVQLCSKSRSRYPCNKICDIQQRPF